jgi:hypothetical protein
MPVFYYSPKFNVCDCVLLKCRGNFSVAGERGEEGAWASFIV